MLASKRAAVLSAAVSLSMAFTPMFATGAARAQPQPVIIPTSFVCANNRFTNGDFSRMEPNRTPDAKWDEDIDAATGWKQIWQGTTSLADLYLQSQAGIGSPPTPLSGNYASMWIRNGGPVGEAATYREGMFNRLTMPIAANSGSYSFTFKTAPLYPAPSMNGAPSVIGIYGVYRPSSSAPLPQIPLDMHTPTNIDLFSGNAVLLGTVVVSPNAGNTWGTQTMTFDSASFGSLAQITHVMVTKAEGQANQSRYIAFDDFCMQAAADAGIPAFSACCPPWNAVQLAAALSIQPTGSAATPFRISFVPPAQLHSQMNAYVAYLQSLNLGVVQMGLAFQLIDVGAGATPSTSGTTIAMTPLHWTGTGTPGATFFTNNLAPNRWYRVQSFLLQGGGLNGFIPQACVSSVVNVRWRPLPGGRGLVDIRYEDGRTEVRYVTP